MPSSLFLFLASTLVAPASAQLGSVLVERKITGPSFPGVLSLYDNLGCGLDRVGDLNGDGVVDLAIGSYGDDDGGRGRGAVWIAFLNADGSVQSATKISQTAGGFTGSLGSRALFGRTIAGLGDVDGNGAGDIAVVADVPRRVYILLLNADGTVHAQTTLLAGDPVFGGLASEVNFRAGGLSAIGDVDGDGVPDIAWGAPAHPPGINGPGAVWVVRLNSDGSAKGATRITSGESGFTAVLEPDAGFGGGLCQLGDVNGDGRPDLGVIDSKFDPERMRLWVLFLDTNAQVLGHAVTSGADLDLDWVDGSGHTNIAYLGWDLDAVGDLDGDGIQEVAVSLRDYLRRGGFSVLFLAADGSVRKRLNVGNGRKGLAPDARRGVFGMALSALGDLDGDGTPELAVGDPGDSTSGTNVGAFTIVSLDVDPVRNGSGVNPLILSEKSEPVLGRQWKLTLDCSGHGNGFASLEGRTRKLAGQLVPQGELLVDQSSLAVFLLARRHGGGTTQFLFKVPNDVSLINLEIFSQGLCTGAPGPQLSNALDSLVGR